jgi:thiamine biosynthesis lipoprotein
MNRAGLPFFLLILVVFAASCSFSSRTKVMGTWVEVKGGNASLAVAEIRRIEKLFSRFDPSSEVSLINQMAGKGAVLASKDTFRVIDQACRISELSNGAFDVTLGRRGSFRDIILDRNTGKIGLRWRGMEIDLGGIGKGYAVEAARKALLSSGTLKALIDMHSSMAAIGGPWKIGIRDPRRRNKILGVVELQDGEALATSADYEQPGHLLDPRSGRPAGKCLSVTVITLDAGLADALSTAIFVLGPAEGLQLAGQMKAKVLIIDNKGKKYDNFGFKLR